MFCTQCGANNADTAAVCMQCGTTLQTATPMPGTGVVLQSGTGVTNNTAPNNAVPNNIVPNYLVFAILATVFCCLPAGIPAIVYAAQVNAKLQAGDIPGAQASSRNAKTWCLVSLGLGVGLVAMYVLLIMLGILGGISQHLG